MLPLIARCSLVIAHVLASLPTIYHNYCSVNKKIQCCSFDMSSSFLSHVSRPKTVNDSSMGTLFLSLSPPSAPPSYLPRATNNGSPFWNIYGHVVQRAFSGVFS